MSRLTLPLLSQEQIFLLATKKEMEKKEVNILTHTLEWQVRNFSHEEKRN